MTFYFVSNQPNLNILIKIIGSSKSSIVRVGGIRELKTHSFFSSINWLDLENGDISPPTSFISSSSSSNHHENDILSINTTFQPTDNDQSSTNHNNDQLEIPQLVSNNTSTTSSHSFEGFSFIDSSLNHLLLISPTIDQPSSSPPLNQPSSPPHEQPSSPPLLPHNEDEEDNHSHQISSQINGIVDEMINEIEKRNDQETEKS